jgi:hypothetical protein
MPLQLRYTFALLYRSFQGKNMHQDSTHLIAASFRSKIEKDYDLTLILYRITPNFCVFQLTKEIFQGQLDRILSLYLSFLESSR